MIYQQGGRQHKTNSAGELILITGGARSGKSTFAENLAKGYGGNILYVATAVPFDDEMKLRVKKHREQRPSEWETVEAYKDMDLHLRERLRNRDAVLLDCITVMVTNIMFENCPDFDRLDLGDIDIIEESANIQINKLIETAKTSKVPFILVTNEIGMGIVPENKSARVFRDVAGRVNQTLAAAADKVFLCVSGIPVQIK